MSNFRQKVLKRFFYILWSTITLSAVLIIIFMIQDLIKENSILIKTIVSTSHVPVDTSETSPHNSATTTTVAVKAFIISKDQYCLLPVDVQIEWKPSYQQNCRQILTAMSSLNSETYFSPISEDILPRSIFLLPSGELIIDLPASIITKYEKNTTAMFESMFTYSIVNTLLQKEITGTTQVNRVQFLIEGSLPYVDFPKHISWEQTFIPNYSLVCE